MKYSLGSNLLATEVFVESSFDEDGEAQFTALLETFAIDCWTPQFRSNGRIPVDASFDRQYLSPKKDQAIHHCLDDNIDVFIHAG